MKCKKKKDTNEPIKQKETHRMNLTVAVENGERGS